MPASAPARPRQGPALHRRGAAWLAGAALLALAPAAPAAAPDSPAQAPRSIDAVQACLRANLPRTAEVHQAVLTHTDRRGTVRTVQGQLTVAREDGLLRAALRLTAPGDVSGLAYLVRQRPGAGDLFVYLPALDRVRRIGGSGFDGSLPGTGISVQDVRFAQQALDGVDATLEGPARLDGRPVTVLRVRPAAGNAGGNTGMGMATGTGTGLRVWVDDATCTVLRAEADAGGRVTRRLTSRPADLRRQGRYWYAETLTLDDLVGGGRTVLSLPDRHSDVDLPLNQLMPTAFYR